MSFTSTPLDGSSPPIPMSSAVPDGTNTPIAVEAGPSKSNSGNTIAPVATYHYDGYDVTQGQLADTAVTGDTSGSVSAKLRGLSKIWNDMWDSTNHWLQVKVMNANANGPQTMANSSPVVIASNQSAISVNVQHGNLVDSGNSSTALLTANSVFTGTSTSSLNYSAVSVEVFTDQNSAAGGLVVQQSQDGTNWDTKDSFTITASVAFQTVVNLTGQFYQIKYTNGGTNQGTFRLQVIKQAVEEVMPRTLTANGNLKIAIQEDNTSGLATSANQTTANTSLGSIVTNTTGLATQTTLAAAKTDLDSIVTNTTGIATASNQTTANTSLSSITTNTSNTATNTSTIAGAVSSGKMQDNIAQIGGQTPTLDNTTILATSMRGKGAGTAGDTALLLDTLGRLLTGRNTVAVYTLASVATSGSTQNSSDFSVASLTEISIDINTTAQSGTSPTIQYFYERKGADGIYYVLWQSAVLTSATNTLSTSIGAGMAYNQSLGLTGRLRWVVGGTSTPTFTHSLNIYGK